jgi:hypothetical protein
MFFFLITCVRIEFIVAEINQLDFIFLSDALKNILQII